MKKGIFGLIILLCFRLHSTEAFSYDPSDESSLDLVEMETDLLNEKARLGNLINEINELEKSVREKQEKLSQKELNEVNQNIQSQNVALASIKKDIDALKQQLSQNEKTRNQLLSKLKSEKDLDSSKITKDLKVYQKKSDELVQNYLKFLEKKEATQKIIEIKELSKQEIAVKYNSHKNLNKKSIKPKKNSSRGLIIGGEYLYWQTRQSDLDVAGRGDIYPGEILSPDFDWRSGFRVNLGYSFNCNWTTDISYLQFRPRGKSFITGIEGNIDPLFYTRISPFSAQGFQITPFQTEISMDNLSSVDSHVALKLDMVDWSFIRNIYCSGRFFLDLLFGIQGANIREKFLNDYTGTGRIVIAESGQPLITNLFDYVIYAKEAWFFRAGGLNIGVNGKICLFSNLFFLLDAKASIFIGSYKNTYNYFTEQDITGSEVDINFETLFKTFRTMNGSEDFFAINSLYSLRTGFSCQKSFYKCRQLDISVFYEAMLWNQLSRFRRGLQRRAFIISETPSSQFSTAEGMTSSIAPTNICFHGLVVSAMIKF